MKFKKAIALQQILNTKLNILDIYNNDDTYKDDKDKYYYYDNNKKYFIKAIYSRELYTSHSIIDYKNYNNITIKHICGCKYTSDGDLILTGRSCPKCYPEVYSK